MDSSSLIVPLVTIDGKTFESYQEAALYIMNTRGFTEKTANALVTKIAENQRSSDVSGMLPEFTETKEGQFAKFFLLNSQFNQMDWRVSSDSIPKYLDTFKDMPYISEPNLEHFGMKEDTPVSETLVTQEKYKAGTIVKTGYVPNRDVAFAVVKFENNKKGKETFKELRQGKAIYVSPAVVGIANIDEVGRTTYDTWHGLHLARVKNPAYGVMAASIKETCEGPGSSCINTLFSSAVASGIIKPCQFKELSKTGNDSFNTHNLLKDILDIAELKIMDPETNLEIAVNKDSLAKIQKFYSTKIAATEKTVADLNEKIKASIAQYGDENECGEGEHMLDGKCVKKDVASITDPAAKKLIDTLTQKVASFEDKEKEGYAVEIVDKQIETGMVTKENHQKTVEELMKSDVASLRNLYDTQIPLLDKIISLNANSPGNRNQGKKLVHIPEGTGMASGGSDKPSSLDDMQGYI